MKRLVTVGLALALSFAWADGAFMGGGLSLYFFLPMASVQAGVDVTEHLRLRGDLDSLLFVNTLSGDVLYTFIPFPLRSSPCTQVPAPIWLSYSIYRLTQSIPLSFSDFMAPSVLNTAESPLVIF